MFYILKDSMEIRNFFFQFFEDVKLLFESNSYKDFYLMQMKCFLFGFLNEGLVK